MIKIPVVLRYRFISFSLCYQRHLGFFDKDHLSSHYLLVDAENHSELFDSIRTAYRLFELTYWMNSPRFLSSPYRLLMIFINVDTYIYIHIYLQVVQDNVRNLVVAVRHCELFLHFSILSRFLWNSFIWLAFSYASYGCVKILGMLWWSSRTLLSFEEEFSTKFKQGKALDKWGFISAGYRVNIATCR